MSAGKARLLTGIACVGTLVVLASIAIYFDAASAVLPASPTTPAGEFTGFLLFFTAFASLLFTFDFVGGVLIPSACESDSGSVWSWLVPWFRSVAMQILFYSVTFFCYLQIGREIGAPWLIALFAVLQVMLLAGQEFIWQLTTANRRERVEGVGGSSAFVKHSDQRFVGGVTGLPGFESVLVPEGWKHRLQPSYIKMLVTRRRSAVSTGLRMKGIVYAMLWNISSFAIAIVASGGIAQSVADLVSVFLWFLLLSFAGLLVLPAFNRRGVFALDQQLAKQFSAVELQPAILDVDRMTEQEPERSVSAESVFQPIPCPERRARVLASGGTVAGGAWNVARTALFLSWAFGGPLARAVHCNVGRPELWAILPTD